LNRPVAPDPYSVLPPLPKFLLTSDDIRDGEPLALPQTAEGGNVSPQLAWSGFPEATASFLLSCFDPDAPREGGMWHWMVADIPTAVTSITSGSARSMVRAVASRFFRAGPSTGIDESVDLPNGLGGPGYLGAAPPKGDRVHRYFFAVAALDVAHLELPHGRRTAPALVAATAIPHAIARAVLVGTFQR
jgi:Raf kinase inhibitor-like YbhB/YbcL family protein